MGNASDYLPMAIASAHSAGNRLAVYGQTPWTGSKTRNILGDLPATGWWANRQTKKKKKSIIFFLTTVLLKGLRANLVCCPTRCVHGSTPDVHVPSAL